MPSFVDAQDSIPFSGELGTSEGLLAYGFTYLGFVSLHPGELGTVQSTLTAVAVGTSRNQAAQIDPSTLPLDSPGKIFDTTIAPEPSTLTLLGIGAVGVLGYGCQRRRKQAA